MRPTIALIAERIIEVMFFTGLLGCVVVVVLSWISVGRDSFSDK
jgi:hypothetical protein